MAYNVGEAYGASKAPVVNRGGNTYKRKPIPKKKAAAPVASSSAVRSGDLAAAIKAALAQRGVPYSWGGGGRSGASRGMQQGANTVGFDCSALMQYAFAKAGVNLPRTSREQAKVGQSINASQAKPGDLIFFDHSGQRPGIDHVALYLGNGKILEAPGTGKTVRISNVNLNSAAAIRRVVAGNTGSATSGLTGEFERFAYAIQKQESGGKYNARGPAVGGDRAYGKYQVMGNNIPSWTKKYLGRSMTPEQFLSDPAAQDKVALSKLREYYDKYGAAGAAAAWYGGEGGARKYLAGGDVTASVGPKLRTYVSQVMSKMGSAPVGAGTGVTNRTSGASSSNNERTPEQERVDFETALSAAGFGSALINSNSELKNIFRQGVADGWTAERFAAAVKNTKWYRSRSNKQREYDTLRQTDPGTWNDHIHDQVESIRSVANGMGVNLSDERLNTIARTSLRNDLTEGEIQRAVAAEFNYDPKKVYKGQAGDTLNQVRDLAHSYGIAPTTAHMGNTLRTILSGANTVDGLKAEYIKQAKSRYAHFSNELDAGKTMAQIADPYVRTMAQTLELNPESLDLTDRAIQKGLAAKDPKTNAVSAMPIWQYEEALKNDDRWLRTNNARESMMTVGQDLLKSFGLVV